MILASGYSTTNYGVSAAGKGWGTGWPNCAAPQTIITLARSGVRLNVHPQVATLFLLLFNEMERGGYMAVKGWCWGGECRAISGTSRASNHSWNLAVDLNAPNNPYTSSGVHDIPSWVFALFRRYGFGLGADYSGKQDWMHIEFMGTPADAALMTALAKKEFEGAVGRPSTPTTTTEQPTTTPIGDWFDMATQADLRQAIIDLAPHIGREAVKALLSLPQADGQYGYGNDAINKIADRVWSQMIASGSGVFQAQSYLANITSRGELNEVAKWIVAQDDNDYSAVIYEDNDGRIYWSEDGVSTYVPDPETLDGLKTVAAQMGKKVLEWPGGNVDLPGAFGARDGVIPKSEKVPPPTTYTVKKGDSFNAIAKAQGVTPDALAAANPQVTNRENINEGQVLTLPK